MDAGTSGGPVVRTCAELPASFPDAHPPAVHPVIAAICIGASGACKVTNDPYGEGALTQCNDTNQERAGHISTDTNGLVFVGQGVGWRIAWQSANPNTSVSMIAASHRRAGTRRARTSNESARSSTTRSLPNRTSRDAPSPRTTEHVPLARDGLG